MVFAKAFDSQYTCKWYRCKSTHISYFENSSWSLCVIIPHTLHNFHALLLCRIIKKDYGFITMCVPEFVSERLHSYNCKPGLTVGSCSHELLKYRQQPVFHLLVVSCQPLSFSIQGRSRSGKMCVYMHWVGLLIRSWPCFFLLGLTGVV